MLWGYFDESGHESIHHIVAMAGWLGSPEDFAALEERWFKLLDKYGLKEFHAKNISPHYGPCKGWPQKRINELRTDFVGATTTDGRLFGISNAVKVSDFNRVMGGHKWLSQAFMSPFEMCCRLSVESAYKWMRLRPEWADEQLSVVFAANDSYKGAADRCKKRYAEGEFYEGRIATVTAACTTNDTCPDRTRTMAALQAADLHAHEAFLYSQAHFSGQILRRPLYKRLFDETLVAEPQYLDAAGLCELGLQFAIGELGIKGAQEIGVFQHLAKRSAALIGTL